MTTEVTASNWKVECDELEAVPFKTGSSDAPYPLPRLRRTGRSGEVTLRTVEIENSFLRVVLCPDLGGRILEIVDLNHNVAVLPRPGRISITDHPIWGATWEAGLRFDCGSSGLGPVDVQVRNDLGAVFVHHLVPGIPLSWTSAVSLEDTGPVLAIETRVSNRSLFPLASPFGWFMLLPDAAWSLAGREVLAYRANEDAGLRVSCISVESVSHDESWVRWSAADSVLLPRQTSVLKLKVQVFSGLGVPTFVMPDIVGSLANGVKLAACRDMEGSKVFVKTPEGDTMEADIDLSAKSPFMAEVGFTPQAVAVRVGGQRHDAVQLSALPEEVVLEPSHDLLASELLAAANGQRPGSREAAFFADIRSRRASTSLPSALSSAFWTWRAVQHSAAGEWALAKDSIHQALATNSDDVLLWWFKAACERHAGAGDESTLLNAHFLAPLEPCLLAEGLLTAWSEDSTIELALPPAFTSDPGAFLEVVNQYIEHGLIKDAGRLLDTAFKSIDAPLLRYVYAWNHLEHSNLVAEAAQQISLAGKIEVEPPYPWRESEKRAVQGLHNRFPNDPRLLTWVGLIDQFTPSL